jgi:hypothetical protein
MAGKEFEKSPGAVLKYKFDWSDWLASGETISTKTVTPETGITVDSSSITDTSTSVTVTLSGGTAGNVYDVVCLITTSDSQTDERTMKITCRQR